MELSRKRWFEPLKQALLLFFKHDVSLQRDAGRVRLVLNSRSPADAQRAPTRAEQAEKRHARDLGQARTALARLLDGDEAPNASMRNLAVVEDALQRGGWSGLQAVPFDLLQQALSELEALITNWSDEGLACLRSRMAVALTARSGESDEVRAQKHRALSALKTPRALAARAIESAMAPVQDDDTALLAAYEALGVAAADRESQ